jgi:Fe-S-cluster-containing dehydrogenase component
MNTWRMIIDVARCLDCNNCTLACKDEHVDNEWPGYTLAQPRHGHRWIDIERTERGQFPLIDVAYMPVLCMHCEDAPCVKASDGAITRRADGIVLIDPVKSRGRLDLVGSCPYGLIWWNEAEQTPQKCTLCAHLLDEGWKQPRCVQACPTGALRVELLDDEAMRLKAETEKLECLHPEFKTKPHAYYRNIYRYASCFIGGSLAVTKDGVEECLSGADVSLIYKGREVGKTATDVFGDFRFDGLAAGEEYTVQIAAESRQAKTLTVKNMEKGKSLGTILLVSGQ